MKKLRNFSDGPVLASWNGLWAGTSLSFWFDLDEIILWSSAVVNQVASSSQHSWAKRDERNQPVWYLFACKFCCFLQFHSTNYTLKSWRELVALQARRQSIVRNRWGLAFLFKRCSASRVVIITQWKLFFDANDGLDRVAQIKQKPLSEAIYSTKTAILRLVRVGKLRTKNLKISFFEPKFVVYREKQCFCLVPCSFFNFDKKWGISPTRLSKMAQILNIFEFQKKYQISVISSPSRKMKIKRFRVPKTI